jgi:zinc transport system ATP-binding protein
MEKVLDVKNLNVTFNGNEVIRDLSFVVESGTTQAVVGPNGAGKTVLFRALLGLIEYSGIIAWAPEAKIGYVPQKLTVSKDFPLSVGEFMNFKTKEDLKIFGALRSVGFIGDEHHLTYHVLSKKVGFLSGGDFQKMLIAWAMIDEPDVLLFDEPTAGVDIGGEETIYSLLEKLKKEHGLTVIFISHDIHIIYRYTDKVLCLNKSMICYGEPHHALSQEILNQLYGPNAGTYVHKH